MPNYVALHHRRFESLQTLKYRTHILCYLYKLYSTDNISFHDQNLRIFFHIFRMTQDTPRLNCLCLQSQTISCYFLRLCSMAWQHTHLRNCFRKMFTLRLLFPSSRAICRQKNCGRVQLATATTQLISRYKQEIVLTNKYPANMADI